MKTINDIIDYYSVQEFKPTWWPCYWLGFSVWKPYEIFYHGGSYVLDCRCTRECIVIFEFNFPELTWYSCGLSVTKFKADEIIEIVPF